jgi:hypothetical protein
MAKYIVVINKEIDDFIGPFNSELEAKTWASLPEAMLQDNSDWYICEIADPIESITVPGSENDLLL